MQNYSFFILQLYFTTFFSVVNFWLLLLLLLLLQNILFLSGKTKMLRRIFITQLNASISEMFI